MQDYCAAKGYQVTLVVKEIASGVNDSCPKLLRLFKDTSVTLIVVEHKDRLTRFGFHYLETLLETQGRTIEVVNLAENDQEDVILDLTAIVYSFTAHLCVDQIDADLQGWGETEFSYASRQGSDLKAADPATETALTRSRRDRFRAP